MRFQEITETLSHHLLDDSADFTVVQLILRLSLELRIMQLDRDDRRQTLFQVICRKSAFLLTDQVVLLRVVVESTCQRHLESGHMRSSSQVDDIVGECEQMFLETVRELK